MSYNYLLELTLLEWFHVGKDRNISCVAILMSFFLS